MFPHSSSSCSSIMNLEDPRPTHATLVCFLRYYQIFKQEFLDKACGILLPLALQHEVLVKGIHEGCHNDDRILVKLLSSS